MDDLKELDVAAEDELDVIGDKAPAKKVSEKKEEVPDEFANLSKDELKRKLYEAYSELGQKFYKEVCCPNPTRPRDLPKPSLFTEHVTKIKAIKEKLDKIIAEELAAKGLKACPDCDNEVVIASKFCNMCGYKFPVKDEKKMKPASQPRCRQCGAYLEPESVFCPDCGKRQ